MRCISHTVDVVHHNVIVASVCKHVCRFDIKVGERQVDFFPNWHGDVPHAVSIGLVIHGPVLGFYNPCFLFGSKTAPLDF